MKMRRTTRDEKIVNPGVYEVPVKSCKEWVGLHEHELQVLAYNDPSGERLQLAKAVEAKLKEKNT